MAAGPKTSSAIPGRCNVVGHARARAEHSGGLGGSPARRGNRYGIARQLTQLEYSVVRSPEVKMFPADAGTHAPSLRLGPAAKTAARARDLVRELWRRSASATSRAMAAPMAAWSSGSTVSAASPATSPSDPPRVVTTGHPEAIASTTVRPKPSQSETSTCARAGAIKNGELVVAHEAEETHRIGDAQIVSPSRAPTARWSSRSCPAHARTTSTSPRFRAAARPGEHSFDVLVPVARSDVEEERACRRHRTARAPSRPSAGAVRPSIDVDAVVDANDAFGRNTEEGARVFARRVADGDHRDPPSGSDASRWRDRSRRRRRGCRNTSPGSARESCRGR